jgi:hypothetical protein
MRNVFEVNIELSESFKTLHNEGVCNIYRSSCTAEMTCINDSNRKDVIFIHILINTLERRLSELPMNRITATKEWNFSNKVFENVNL